MKDSTVEPFGQNLIKLISNLCFSFFVFSVLIFTVIAITYQPPDPWLESAPALTRLFTETENATFQIDNSIIKTGEDIASALVYWELRSWRWGIFVERLNSCDQAEKSLLLTVLAVQRDGRSLEVADCACSVLRSCFSFCFGKSSSIEREWKTAWHS